MGTTEERSASQQGRLSEQLTAAFFGVYLVLLLLSLLASYCLAHHVRCKLLSEAGVTLLIAFVGGGLLELFVSTDTSDQFGEMEVRNTLVGFSSNILFCVLLPPIIFASGYRMRGPFFWANLDKILSLAFVGTLASSLIVGALMFAAQGVMFVENLSLAEAMTFGALISATDPVTTLAVFEQLNVDPNLFNIIFGESVLNDAVSIVLFHTFSKLIGFSGGVVGILVLAVANFAVIFVSSSLVGFLLGCSSSLLFKHLQLHEYSREHGPQLELAVFLVLGYVPYLLAECLKLSGIVAILFAGFAMKRYTSLNLSEDAHGMAGTTLSLMAHVAEACIFIDLGTSAWRSFRASPGIVLWAASACVLARAAHVYPIGLLLNSGPARYPRRKFQRADMHMVWFSGLRGAIAYALSAQFPGKHGHCVMSVTMALVLGSVWLLGGATVPMIRFLGIRQLQEPELKQLSLTLKPAVDRLAFVNWDRNFVRPLLVRGLVSSTSASVVDNGGQVMAASSQSPRTLQLQVAGSDSSGFVQLTEGTLPLEGLRSAGDQGQRGEEDAATGVLTAVTGSVGSPLLTSIADEELE